MKDGHPQEPGRRFNRLRGRGKAAAGAVGSDGIVLAPPLLDQHGRLRQRVEDLPVQQLVPELAVEALVAAVLPRAARLDKERLDAHAPQPPPHELRGELPVRCPTSDTREARVGRTDRPAPRARRASGSCEPPRSPGTPLCARPALSAATTRVSAQAGTVRLPTVLAAPGRGDVEELERGAESQEEPEAPPRRPWSDTQSCAGIRLR